MFGKYGIIAALAAALAAASVIGYLAWRLEAVKADRDAARIETQRLVSEAEARGRLEGIRAGFREEVREAMETIRSDMDFLNRELLNDPDTTDSCWDSAVGRNLERLRQLQNRDSD